MQRKEGGSHQEVFHKGGSLREGSKEENAVGERLGAREYNLPTDG